MPDPVSELVDTNVVDIDEHALDREWVSQPRNVLRYTTKLANAKHEVATAKARLDVIEAELDQRIRANPEAFGIQGKPTENMIERRVVLAKDYQACLDRLNTAQHRVDLLTGVVKALEHKKDGLESLVYLQGRAYYAEPTASYLPPAAREEMANAAKKAARTVNKKHRGDD